jgi:hypothetical protein
VIDHTSREYQPRCLGRASIGDYAPSITGGHVLSELTIKQEVEAELRWEPSVNAAGIGVAVKDGIVTLTGQVATLAEKYAAARAAARVAGVNAVANDLEVGLLPADRRSGRKPSVPPGPPRGWRRSRITSPLRLDAGVRRAMGDRKQRHDAAAPPGRQP